MITRTPDIEVDQDFEAHVPITKAYVDTRTGQRHIVGVASGVAEDRDGERVSKRGVLGMIKKVSSGVVKLTSSHQQDWMTEFGDVVKADHDAETDEMFIDTVLPPEGVDPIADKAWLTANRERVGFSVGGKLLKSYFEKDELGKKRKVLDAIDLRHIMLTKSPSYPHSFAEAVAKTFTGDTPADDAFTLEANDELTEIEKADATGSWASGDSDAGGGNVGRDSVGSGQRNAGTKDSKGMSTEEDGSSNDDEKLPKAADERHLACPNCGHEFAADLPLDPNERQVDDTGDDNEPDNDQDEDRDTGKSAEKEMSTLTETLDALKTLAADQSVAKTTEPEATPPAPEVTKTATEHGDIEKMVAASHRHNTERLDTIEKGVSDGFELVAKAVRGLQESIAELPLGRKSIARTFAPGGKGVPSAVGHDAEQPVEKTVEKQVEDADSAVDALKVLNKATYGIG